MLRDFPIAAVRVGHRLMLVLAASVPFGTQAAVQPLVHQYDVAPSGLGGRFATLSSSASCEADGQHCTIENRIEVPAVDRYVQVAWKESDGSVITSTSNFSYWGRVFGPESYYVGRLSAVQATTHGLVAGIAVKAFPGTADFSGTGPGNDPCGIGMICTDASFYAFSAAGVNPAGPGVDPAAPALIGSFTTTFERVALDPVTHEAVPGTVAAFFEFASTLTQDADGFHYFYSVTNTTDGELPFSWEAAGLSGRLAAGATRSSTLLSAAAPALVTAGASVRYEQVQPFVLTDEFSGGTTLLRPVPEPQVWLLLAAGLVCLQWRRAGSGPALRARYAMTSRSWPGSAPGRGFTGPT